MVLTFSEQCTVQDGLEAGSKYQREYFCEISCLASTCNIHGWQTELSQLQVCDKFMCTLHIN